MVTISSPGPATPSSRKKNMQEPKYLGYYSGIGERKGPRSLSTPLQVNIFKLSFFLLFFPFHLEEGAERECLPSRVHGLLPVMEVMEHSALPG